MQHKFEHEPGHHDSAKNIPAQKTALHMALAELQTLNLAAEQVRRVAIERRGTLHLEVHEGEKHRFFEYEANQLREMQIENERKVPLVAKLSDAVFANDYSIISYRPGRRIVLEGINNEQGNIIKAYKKHQAAQAAEKYAIALSACHQGGFDIPELLQTHLDDHYIVMAKRLGRAPRVEEDELETWANIGASLKRFQQAGGTDTLPEFNHRDELDVLDERARRFPLCMSALPTEWLAGREHLERAAKNLPPAVLGLSHRDLHDEQFIVAGETISLLDFDLLCIADVALDAGNLLAHMKLRCLQGRQKDDGRALDGCKKVFLEGLNRQDEPGFEQRLNFYQAATFYRLALLYALRPRWAHLSGSLVEQGNRCINTLGQRQGEAL